MSGDGELVVLDIKPGVNKDVTEYAAEGYWVSSDHVRFQDGKAEKQGGWVIEQTVQASVSGRSTFYGVARDIITWKGLDNKKYLALGTHEKLQLLYGGKYYDITPVRTTVTAVSVFNTQANSPLITVSLVAHAAAVNDYIVIPTIATIGDNVLIGGEYQIVSVISPDAFMISANVSAAITTAAVGATTTALFLLPTGRRDNGLAYGWGAGVWGRNGWGEPASSGAQVDLTQWSLDNYGQNLIACPRGGSIYQWVASAGVNARAEILTASPTVNDVVLINKTTRHAMSFGCTDALGVYDPLLVRWSDQENINNWTETVTNAAGSFPLQGGGRIVAVQPTRRETLILTNDIVHSMRNTGTEAIFTFEPVGQQAGAISQHCAVDVNGDVYWMGLGSFYKYNGTVANLNTTIDKELFSDGPGSINFSQKEKVFAGVNALFTEVIWFYPSRDSVEIDRYAVHNYTDNVQYTGSLDRTVWEDVGIFQKPYGASSDGELFVHEEGYNDDAAPMSVYLESGWFDIKDGTDMIFIDRFIPDIRRLLGRSIDVTIKVKKYPDAPEEVTKGPYTITDTTNKISLRARGRQAKIIFTQAVTNSDFELGNNRVSIQKDGKR
jgi:hypothetical protein